MARYQLPMRPAARSLLKRSRIAAGGIGLRDASALKITSATIRSLPSRIDLPGAIIFTTHLPRHRLVRSPRPIDGTVLTYGTDSARRALAV
jgi:hypothetical protein